ncbi:hypothetical protein GCM10025331_43590 [Actinoplanes utahensis]|uniref:Uncharacterized protein n=2 Tax=Actinoplanes utahensis TaxID=1869 RepID=A0A0A6UPB1_ACTUT|nr:hypothetical protein MB27_13800 [Actinoplanes utahensis]GIF27365.1 hypothetical protein Aut01nite_03510 [Actinoplanes utahensis]
MLAVALAAVLGVAGCAKPGAAPSTGRTTPSGDARAALLKSAEALKTGSYSFSRTGAYLSQDVQRGDVHLPDGVLLEHEQRAAMRVGDVVYLRYLLHGSAEMRDQYMKLYKQHGATAAQLKDIEKIYALLDGKRWVRADAKELVAAAAIDEQSGLDYMAPLPKPGEYDVPGAGGLVTAVTTAARAGDTITGTLDATKVDPDLNLLFSDPTHLYGPAAKTMSYQAVLDGQGRLTEFTVTMPGQLASEPAGGHEPEPPLVIKISGYGETAAPTAPKDAPVLPPSAYEMLSRDVD